MHFERDVALVNSCPFPRTPLAAWHWPLTWRKSMLGLVRRIRPSNRLMRWSARLTSLATAFSSFILTGTRCVAIPASRKLSHHSRRSSRKTYSCYIKYRLADPIYLEVPFDQCVLQRSRAKGREAEPGGDETERLA